MRVGILCAMSLVALTSLVAPPSFDAASAAARIAPEPRVRLESDGGAPLSSGSDRDFFGYIRQWTMGAEVGMLQSIATDDSGNVYVLSWMRVWKYTNDGVLVTSWGKAGGGSFSCPTAIAVSPAGIVYVVDACESNVQSFSPVGIPLGQWGGAGTGHGQFSNPSSIAVDDAGEIYVLDSFPARVQKLTTSGVFLAEWGSDGSADGEFTYPTGIAADHLGHVFVADYGNQRIQEFMASGEHVATWPVSGFAVAVEPGNDVYVLDDVSAQIVKYGAEGGELGRWGGFGRAEGQFLQPVGIATDPDGNVFVADVNTLKVQKFGMATRWFITATAGPNGTIKPPGVVDVAQGMDRTYALAPDLGFQVEDLVVDGTSLGPVAGHTFADVVADHTIEGTFATLVGWPHDPALNLPVCIDSSLQSEPQLVSDGAGGAIIAWQDRSPTASGTTIGVYAQRVDELARPQWPLRGLCVTAGTTWRYLERIVPDGSGGAIVMWLDQVGLNHSLLWAQRFDATGAPQWPGEGVCITPVAQGQPIGDALPDGEHGIVVVWSDSGPGISYGIFAQRLDASGVLQWGPAGVQIRSGSFLAAPGITSDGSHGVIAVWSELRNGGSYDLYAQRIDSTGTVRWNVDGVPVCVTVGAQYGPVLVPDGSGGAIVVWQDLRSGPPLVGIGDDYCDLYAQRLDDSGVARWAANGVRLCAAPGDQVDPRLVSDGAGGAIAVWRDWRGGDDLYAGRLRANGEAAWGPDGVPVCGVVGDRDSPALIANEPGTAIVAWWDGRQQASGLYIQRLGTGGTPLWAAEGVPLSTAAEDRGDAAIASDGAGGVILAWSDDRNWNYDIYAQQVSRDGVLGGSTMANVPAADRLTVSLNPVRPNPLHAGVLRVFCTLASTTAGSVELLDVSGRRVVEQQLAPPASGRQVIELADVARLAPGLYFVRLHQGAEVRSTRVVVVH